MGFTNFSDSEDSMKVITYVTDNLHISRVTLIKLTSLSDVYYMCVSVFSEKL
jgi:hypothetical protein